MSISIFNLFSIGIGPSSSHTVGPMYAMLDFLSQLKNVNQLQDITRIQVGVYGSLALTGKAHGTTAAVISALEGHSPETVIPKSLIPRFNKVLSEKEIHLLGEHSIAFDPDIDLKFHMNKFLEKHSNGMHLSAFDRNGNTIKSQVYYSIGGGFIVTAENYGKELKETGPVQPFPFSTANKLLYQCRKNNMQIYEVMLENEKVWRSENEIKKRIFKILNIMSGCIEKGCTTSGELPGGLQVMRRAPELYKRLQNRNGIRSILEDADIMNRLNMYAMAVNEENAAGGRIVTAPTNGAAGVIPAVLEYYKQFHKQSNEEGLLNFFLTAGAVGLLYKKNASISGAEVGCQGEIGVASSMAAAGLTAALEGTNEQVENAAEIAMEHHLGMTCDPVAGLVQIPCIERNAMGAVKAVNAARMALIGNGHHKVSLDSVIKTMRETGHNMMTIYKETSQGGLAVNVPEC